MFDNDDNLFKVDMKANNGVKNLIKVLIVIVYTAGALFATLAFQREVSSLFKDYSPLLSTLATVGAWANFCSVVVMLFAKDHWVTGTAMMVTACIGWGIEVLMMAANTLAAYGSTWTTGWVQLTPATPVFVIALWGILWLMHPDHQQRQQVMQFQASMRREWMNKLARSMQAPEVQDQLNKGALQAAQQLSQQAHRVVLGGTYTADLSQHAKTQPAPIPELNDPARQNGHKPDPQ